MHLYICGSAPYLLYQSALLACDTGWMGLAAYAPSCQLKHWSQITRWLSHLDYADWRKRNGQKSTSTRYMRSAGKVGVEPLFLFSTFACAAAGVLVLLAVLHAAGFFLKTISNRRSEAHAVKDIDEQAHQMVPRMAAVIGCCKPCNRQQANGSIISLLSLQQLVLKLVEKHWYVQGYGCSPSALLKPTSEQLLTLDACLMPTTDTQHVHFP